MRSPKLLLGSKPRLSAVEPCGPRSVIWLFDVGPCSVPAPLLQMCPQTQFFCRNLRRRGINVNTTPPSPPPRKTLRCSEMPSAEDLQLLLAQLGSKGALRAALRECPCGQRRIMRTPGCERDRERERILGLRWRPRRLLFYFHNCPWNRGLRKGLFGKI